MLIRDVFPLAIVVHRPKLSEFADTLGLLAGINGLGLLAPLKELASYLSNKAMGFLQGRGKV